MIGNCLSGAGLFYSVLVTAVITDAIKDAVGQPRPRRWISFGVVFLMERMYV
jgi:hypothetical protein